MIFWLRPNSPLSAFNASTKGREIEKPAAFSRLLSALRWPGVRI
jgi:hypothetical protein